MNRYVLLVICTIFFVGCQTQHTPATPVTPGFEARKQHPDDAVSVAVMNAFMNNDLLSALPIQVVVSGRQVILTGYVKTIRQSDIATEIATQVPGVTAVDNRLIVRKG